MINYKFRPLFYFLILGLILFSCQSRSFEKEAGQVESFAEMVAAGVKPIALSPPMNSAEMDLFIPVMERLAEKYQVQYYRESALIQTNLFPVATSEGKEVLIIYQNPIFLQSYQNLKSDLESNTVEDKEDLSRRFGRLLGYPVWKINELLEANSTFRDLEDFGIQGQELSFYYRDLDRAKSFYQNKLGLNLLDENEDSATFQIAGDSRLVLKSVSGSAYSGQENKSVALALLTDNLEAWYAHVQEEKIPIKYTLKQNPEGAHDGFVAIDPEGYFLEFEMFRQHPENEVLMPELQRLEPKATSRGEELNFYATVTWLYYEDMLPMENFMMENLGLKLSADQGWAKIYRVSENSYLGLVDEKRGMNSFSEEKLVEVKFDLKDPQGWEEYLKNTQADSVRADRTFRDLGSYIFRF
ncbi:VOC family protein [Algoriphagus formosus]|uniref:VOC family protein n=1 Tax=Algoriphagus formosus TaxID=2007308 RepID=UPI003F727DDB